jgi:hypothetical protein
MADKAGFVAVVWKEDKARDLMVAIVTIIAIVAVVTKEVNRTSRLKNSRIYSRMYLSRM